MDDLDRRAQTKKDDPGEIWKNVPAHYASIPAWLGIALLSLIGLVALIVAVRIVAWSS